MGYRQDAIKAARMFKAAGLGKPVSKAFIQPVPEAHLITAAHFGAANAAGSGWVPEPESTFREPSDTSWMTAPYGDQRAQIKVSQDKIEELTTELADAKRFAVNQATGKNRAVSDLSMECFRRELAEKRIAVLARQLKIVFGVAVATNALSLLVYFL